MADKVLSVLATAYRATLEEQDDPVLWLTASLRGNGVDIDVLLRGSAVNYLVRAQDAAGLAFGARRQTQPPRLASDITALLGRGARVFFLEQDVVARGIAPEELIEGPSPVSVHAIAELFSSYPHVWRW